MVPVNAGKALAVTGHMLREKLPGPGAHTGWRRQGQQGAAELSENLGVNEIRKVGTGGSSWAGGGGGPREKHPPATQAMWGSP